MFRWWRIHETGDYSFLLIEKRPVKRWEMLKLAEHFEVMFNDYLKRFGLSETAQIILHKKVHIARLKVKKIVTGDKSIKAIIQVEEEKLRLIEEELKGEIQSPFEMKANVEMIVGYQIDPHTTSVTEFQTLIKQLRNGRKQ